MTSSITKAQEILNQIRKAPGMYAICRESWVNMVSTILWMADINFDVQGFYKEHLGVDGNSYQDPLGQVETAWARSVVDDALAMIAGYVPPKK